MPYEGALMDQPGGVIQRFEIIMTVRAEDQQRELEKMKNEPPPKS